MTLNLANEINSTHLNGRVSEAYHAGMSKGMREKVQTKFGEGDINIIVSTVAFGMGVDFTVRCVIIIGAPSSIEEYWQQIGRAGRDGLEAETVLYYQYRSIAIASSMLDKECKNPIVKRNKKNNLMKMGNYFYLRTCRRRFVLEHFDQIKYIDFFCCNNCDNCLNKELVDVTNDVWNIYHSLPIKKSLDFENIKQNLLAQKLIRYASKEKLILINSLANWISYVNFKKYTLSTLPDNLRIKILIQYLYNEKEEDEFDKCEKLLENFFM